MSKKIEDTKEEQAEPVVPMRKFFVPEARMTVEATTAVEAGKKAKAKIKAQAKAKAEEEGDGNN